MICFKMNSRIFVFFKMRKKEKIVIIGFIIELIEFKFEFQRKEFHFKRFFVKILINLKIYNNL